MWGVSVQRWLLALVDDQSVLDVYEQLVAAPTVRFGFDMYRSNRWAWPSCSPVSAESKMRRSHFISGWLRRFPDVATKPSNRSSNASSTKRARRPADRDRHAQWARQATIAWSTPLGPAVFGRISPDTSGPFNGERQSEVCLVKS